MGMLLIGDSIWRCFFVAHVALKQIRQPEILRSLERPQQVKKNPYNGCLFCRIQRTQVRKEGVKSQSVCLCVYIYMHIHIKSPRNLTEDEKDFGHGSDGDSHASRRSTMASSMVQHLPTQLIGRLDFGTMHLRYCADTSRALKARAP